MAFHYPPGDSATPLDLGGGGPGVCVISVARRPSQPAQTRNRSARSVAGVTVPGRGELALYAACLVVVAIVGVRALGDHRRAPGEAVTSVPARAVVDRRPPAVVVVDVAGAVRRPGVYRLREGQRVRDAVRRAGGPAPGAQLAALNRAAKLADGQQVVVPRQAAGSSGAAAAVVPDPAAPAPVSLSSASVEQLQTLDGVGPVTAQKIVDFRSAHGGFRSLDQLAEVPGIGPKRLAALKAKLQP